MKKLWLVTIVLVFCFASFSPLSASSRPDAGSEPFTDVGFVVIPGNNIIVDHNNWDWYNSQSQTVYDQVAGYTIYFAHASVGSNILDGLADLHSSDADKYPLIQISAGDTPPVTTVNGTIYENARGNPGWLDKVNDFETYINNGWHNDKATIVMNKFCYIDENADWTEYRDSMTALEAAYSDTRFIYWTMPLTTGTDADAVKRADFNRNLRDWIATQNGKLLYDIADIEAWDPEGVHRTFTYNSAMYEHLCADYSSDGGHLNTDGAERAAAGLYSLFGQLNSTQLTFTAQPSGADEGEVFATQPEITVQDSNGDTVADSTAAVTLAITAGSGTPGAQLSGTTTVNAVNGVAVFNDLSIDLAGEGYTLTATSAGMIQATSSAFDITTLPGSAPEISLEGNSTEIVSGDDTPDEADLTDLGSITVSNGHLDRNYIIRNTGDGTLTLPGTPRVNLSGANAGDFSVINQPVSPVAPAGSTIFTIRFNPSTAGLRTATVNIGNNDADENPYTFAIAGHGLPSILAVTSPNGGEHWVLGTRHSITWTSNGLSGKVKIMLSRNGGRTWSTIVSSTPNDGSQDWVVSGTATDQAKIKISSLTQSTIYDVSDANFSLSPSITLISPDGDEIWAAGSNQVIRWLSRGVNGKVKIMFSGDGGSTWTVIAASTSNDGNYTWKVSGTATTQACIKIESIVQPGIYDISPANFSIVIPSISVLVPVGGETWDANTTHNISWTSSGVSGRVKIQLSRNGGLSWSTISSSTLNDGSFDWRVNGNPTTQARIKISSVSQRDVSDISDLFSILRH